ncbi:MAG TPA: AI-2E family transporter [Candidatus Sulfotelmatobacter sp.]|nr:AI-2E family transporter [Candidatus Sulfotelmatobacter sp.]
MAFPDRRTTNIFFTLVFSAFVCAILYAARYILLIFVFAILLAYLIDPVVRFLQRHSLFFKNLRGPHVAEAYLAFVLLLVFAGHSLLPGLININSKIFRTLPVIAEDLSTGDIAKDIGDKYGWSETQELHWKAFLVRHREQIDSLVKGAERFTSNAFAVLVVVPILSIFFLADGGRIADSFIPLVSTEGNRQAIRELADELNAALRRYIRAMVILSGLSFAYYSAALLLLRFPHAIALSVLGGILELIPIAGWMISAATILIVGNLTHCHWIWMAALLGAWRMSMDYFISPRVVGQNLEIHPLIVIFAVMVGGAVGGTVGIYLSIPFVVILRVIWQRYPSLNRWNWRQIDINV